MRALIVKIGALGDAIMALPMISALRETGFRQVSWLCGRSIESLLKVVDGVDEVITIDDEAMFNSSNSRRLRELSRLWARLASAHFDLVVTAHPDWRYRLLTLPLVRCEHRKLGCGGLRPIIRGRHHSNEYLRLVTSSEGAETRTAALPVIRPALPDRLSAELTIGTEPGIIALAPGGAKNLLREDALRRWPLNSYQDLAARLINDGVKVVITGGRSDSWVSESFHRLPVVDLVGKTTIEELLAVYAACDVAVTHDSGPLHLAQLARTPIVALFGPTTPNERVLHLSGGSVFWGGRHLACRPCYDGREYAACNNNACLQEIDVESIHHTVIEILGNRSRQRESLCQKQH